MNREEYDRLRACEDQLWWHRALHDFILKLIPPPEELPGRDALDVGCGPGGFLEKLEARGYRPHGLDFALPAIHFCRERGKSLTAVADANRLPVKDASMDLVTSINVLEMESVEPDRLVSEALRILKPEGCALFLMPAHNWLLSEHDRAVHSVRRFNRRQLIDLTTRPGVEALKATYLFALTFPPMALWKALNRPKKTERREEARSDVELPAPWINRMLYAITSLEVMALPRFSLPLGTTVCALVRKRHV